MPRTEVRDETLLRLIENLFELWKLDAVKRSSLLGTVTSANGSEPETWQTMTGDQRDRIVHLLGIHRRLRLLFPKNLDLAHSWMSARNKAFNDLTPIEVVSKRGISGLAELRVHLDG